MDSDYFTQRKANDILLRNDNINNLWNLFERAWLNSNCSVSSEVFQTFTSTKSGFWRKLDDEIPEIAAQMTGKPGSDAGPPLELS